MNIFLSGGGIGKDSKEVDDAFAEAVDKSKPLLYIPIAIKLPRNDCMSFITDVFSKRGITNIEMWGESEILHNKQIDLKKFGGIYVGGGNTFYLLDFLKKAQFLPRLIDAVKVGIPYYGGSAGAIIVGESLEPAKPFDKNIVNTTDFAAMDLSKGFNFWCHYDEAHDEKITTEKNILLPENTGILIKESEIIPLGQGNVELLIKGKKEIVSKHYSFGDI